MCIVAVPVLPWTRISPFVAATDRRLEWAVTRCLLRIDAKQYLQWIAHGTFEKRTVQSQMLLGYL
jgi:hypothetical protein